MAAGRSPDELIKRAASPLDARQSLLTLTALGRAAFAPLDHRSQDEIGAMLRALPAPAQKRLVEDMAEIETLLGELGAQCGIGEQSSHLPRHVDRIVGVRDQGGVARARQKLERKGADMIVMNDISRRDIGFDSDHNELTLVTSDREIGVSRRSKRACAAAIWDAVALPARTGAEPARA